MDLKEQSQLGSSIDSHWYYKSKAAALLRYIEPHSYQRILDVGAGSGYFTKFLLKHTSVLEGLCIDISYPNEWQETIMGKLIRFQKSCSASLAVDLVLFMDVLEHVDDDVGLLLEYASAAPSRAHFLITVPAFQFLWSGHDIFLEHRRRYTLKSLERVVRLSGLELLAISYYFGFVFPVAAVQRIAQRIIKGSDIEPKSHLKIHSPLTNTVFATLCRLELPFIHINRIAGLTVFCLARKP